MITDALVSFLPIGGNQSMVAGAGQSVVIAPGGVALDLMGLGVGIAPTNIIGNAMGGVWGTDFGIGVRKARLNVSVGTAFATSNSATWNLALQFAADGGTPNYNPSTWTTVVETGAHAVGLAVANYVIRFDWPPQLDPTLNPRFARLLMQFPFGTNLSAGTIASALVLIDGDDQANKYQGRNFSVS